MWLQERENFCTSYLLELSVDVDGILHAVETCDLKNLKSPVSEATFD